MNDSIVAAKNDTLLSYGVETNPSPLQASPKEGDLNVAEIEIAVDNETEGDLYCESISFVLPIGESAQDLVSDKEAKKIKASVEPSSEWEILPGSELGEFEAKPKKPEFRKLTVEGLLIRFYGIEVNTKVGNFTTSVYEKSSRQDRDFKDSEGKFTLAKFPNRFFFSDFVAEKPQVNTGEAVTLTWKGSEDASYTLLYGSNPPVDVTKVRTWTTPKPPGLHVDTTFILNATVVSGSSETLQHYLSTTVTVANPDLQAGSLKVTGESTLDGQTTVGSGADPQPLIVKGPLKGEKNVEAPGGFSGSTLGLTEGATITGGLDVHGNLQAHAGVSMNLLGGHGSQSPGTYQAKSDGFVVGTVSGAGIDPNARCFGWVDAWWSGGYACASGGNVVFTFYSSSWNTSNLGNSFLLPVPNGQTYVLRWTPLGTEPAPKYEFFWFSLGAGGAGEAEGPERLGDVEMMPAPPPPSSAANSPRSGPGRPDPS